MKKYRTKPWAKGLACGLFVLAMTVSVICLGNVRWLAYHGGYQWEGTRQLVEEEEAVWVENLTNQLADGYRSYRDGDQSLDVKRYVEDENFFFTIKDLEGNTLLASDTLGDYREKTSWSMQVGGTVQWSHIDQYYDSYEARDLALDQLGSTYEELQNVSLVEDEEGYRRGCCPHGGQRDGGFDGLSPVGALPHRTGLSGHPIRGEYGLLPV